MELLDQIGFIVFPSELSNDCIGSLRSECEKLSLEESSACVRQICKKSEPIRLTGNYLKRFLPKDMIGVRSIFFNKSKEANWPVAWHQDLTITVSAKRDVYGYKSWSMKANVPHVQPPQALLERMITLRLHLDLASADNGALKCIPESHLLGRLAEKDIPQYTGRSVTCECMPAEVLAMKPLCLHASSRATNPSNRRVLHFEYAYPNDLHEYLGWQETF